MNVANVLEPIINKQIAQPGDYLGEDGLLYCGKCRTPKQTHGEGVFAGRLLPVLCSCMIAEREADELADRRRRIEQTRVRCLPAEDMRRHRFEGADASKHISVCRRYADKWEEVRAKNYGLLLFGNTGTGKSYAAHCIANALIDREVSVCCISAADLVESLADRERREDMLRRIRTVPLMIVDDLGAQRPTSFANEQICRAVDERAEAGKPLIVTTNYTLDEMRRCQDHELQRIFDRLNALCVPVAVVGESRRAALGAEKLREAKALLGA